MRRIFRYKGLYYKDITKVYKVEKIETPPKIMLRIQGVDVNFKPYIWGDYAPNKSVASRKYYKKYNSIGFNDEYRRCISFRLIRRNVC